MFEVRQQDTVDISRYLIRYLPYVHTIVTCALFPEAKKKIKTRVCCIHFILDRVCQCNSLAPDSSD